MLFTNLPALLSVLVSDVGRPRSRVTGVGGIKDMLIHWRWRDQEDAWVLRSHAGMGNNSHQVRAIFLEWNMLVRRVPWEAGVIGPKQDGLPLKSTGAMDEVPLIHTRTDT